MSRPRHNSLPLDRPRLEELALAYVARFATTRAKLEAYLLRKLRERGWGEGGEEGGDDGGEDPARVAAGIADRFVEAGYVDDAAFAQARSGSLLRRGYGMRRVGEVLRAAGVAETVREEVRPGAAATRRAALAFARKRGFGPFGASTARPEDRAERDKRRNRQIAAMLRAGHALDSAMRMVDAAGIDELEEWAASVDESEE